jgi:hypothetical protein
MVNKVKLASDKGRPLDHHEDDNDSSSFDLDTETEGLPEAMLKGHNRKDLLPRRRRSKRGPSINTICTVISTITSIVALSMLAVVLHKPSLLTSVTNSAHDGANNDKLVWKDCGLNSTTSRANGCRYDPMLSSWIHNDCSDLS